MNKKNIKHKDNFANRPKQGSAKTNFKAEPPKLLEKRDSTSKSQRNKNEIIYTQNFIKSSSLIAEIIEKHTSLSKSDKVLEIGTGTGKITRALAPRVGQVVTIEKDRTLVTKLKEKLEQFDNINFVFSDFLEFQLTKMGPYKVFSNIPFSITADIVRKLFFSSNPPEEAYLIMQFEAYDRFIGKDKDGSVLMPAKLLPFYDWSIIHRFDKEDFSPPPRVNTVMAKIVKYENHKIPFTQRKYYWDFVDYAFWKYKGTIRSAFQDLLTDEQLKRLGAQNGFQIRDNIQNIKPASWVELFDYMIGGGVSEIKQKEIMKFKYYKKAK